MVFACSGFFNINYEYLGQSLYIFVCPFLFMRSGAFRSISRRARGSLGWGIAMAKLKSGLGEASKVTANPSVELVPQKLKIQGSVARLNENHE